MAILDRPKRRKLMDGLSSMSIFDSREGRDLLLRGLPQSLIDSIARQSAKVVDLDRIVNACERWRTGPNTQEGVPLFILLENAQDLARGSQAAAEFKQLLDTL